MDTEALRAEIARLAPWHHDIELAPGVWTGERQPDGSWPAELGAPSVIRPAKGFATFAAQVWPNGLEGRSFLDCACNGGGYVFVARAHGAGRCLGFDVREHWIAQARFAAGQVPGEGIEFEVADLADLPARQLPRFDVTWFSGLLYHLPDPIAGLRIACDRTEQLIVVNTSIRPRPYDALMLSQESVVDVMSGVHGLAWFPTNDKVVSEMLAWCGFPHSRLRFDRAGDAAGLRRIQLLAARDAATLADYDTIMPARVPPQRAGWLRRKLQRLWAR